MAPLILNQPLLGPGQPGGLQAPGAPVQGAPQQAAHPLPQHMQGVAHPAVAQQAGQQHIAQPGPQGLAGQARPGGLFQNMRRWFAEVRTSHTPTAGLPAQVQIAMPGGGQVTYDGRDLAQMIRSLPNAERAAARANLSAHLAGRMQHGQTLMQDVLAGHAQPNPTAQDVADVMLFLDAKANAGGQAFSAGAFSIEDPQGHLAAFLNQCPEKYQRSSSHMSDMQRAVVDGHANTHRGIDIPQGPNGLPHGNATTLFAVIPEGAGGQPPRRMFLKMESHGCRLSTLSGAAHQAGQDGVPDRPVRLRTDLREAIGHAFSFIATRGAGSALGSRKERIPDGVKQAFKDFTRESAAILTPAQQTMLQAGNPLGSSGGIRTMMANMRTTLAAMPAGPERNRFAGLCGNLVRSMERSLTRADHMEARIGNEVMFDAADFAPAPGGVAGGAPGGPGGPGGPGAGGAALRPVGPQSPERLICPTPLTPAQEAVLAPLSPARRLQVLAALPQATATLTAMGQLGFAGQPIAGGPMGPAAQYMPLHDQLVQCIEGTSDSIDSATENLGALVDLALAGMPDQDAQAVYAELTSPKGEQMRSAAIAHTMAFTVGARMTPASEVAGHLSKFGFLTGELVDRLETRLQVPQAQKQPLMPSIDPHVQRSLTGIATNDFGAGVLNEAAPGVAQAFVLDVVERSDTLMVNGVDVSTTEGVTQAIADPALRLALTRLANQASMAPLVELTGSTLGSGMAFQVIGAGPGGGGGGGGTRYTFDTATGRFTATRTEPAAHLMTGHGMEELQPGSATTMSFSCTLRMVDGQPVISDTVANLDYNWDIQPQ